LAGVELEDFEALATASLLDLESSADLEALASLSDLDLDSDSDASLLADTESNCSTVKTIFVSFNLKDSPCAGVDPIT
jgi:hypothetical protein